MAGRKANRSSWWFVGFSVTVLVVLAVLIFIVFDWNIREPWTFLSGFLLIVINLFYFARYKSKLDSQGFRERRLEKEKKKLYRKY